MQTGDENKDDHQLSDTAFIYHQIDIKLILKIYGCYFGELMF